LLQSVLATQPQPNAWLTHAVPLAFMVQFEQVVPGWPHPVCVVPAEQAGGARLVLQQPVLHALRLGWPQAVVHACVLVLQVLRLGHSPGWLQPQMPVGTMQVKPTAMPAQLTHTPPPLPHIAEVLPGWQLPLLIALQQPPLHICDGTLHCGPHACVDMLHAWLGGQSLTTPQPQLPPFEPMMHTAPPEAAVHAEHAPPFEPHAPLALPATHELFEQQPPLHAVCVAPPHEAEHLCVLVSHELSTRQSVGWLQPHSPATHAEPSALPVQLAHMPELPHAVAVVPPAQVPLAMLQQPPLHGCVELHAATH
jgi:hypothetical protein